MGGGNCDQTARRINQRADGRRRSEEVGERKRIPACLRRRINPTAARSQHMFESRKKDAAAAGEGLEYGLATAAARVRSGIREEETMPALRQLLPLSRRCLFKPICKPSNRVKCAFPVSQQTRPRPRIRSALALFDSVSLSLSMYRYLRGKSLSHPLPLPCILLLFSFGKRKVLELPLGHRYTQRYTTKESTGKG